MCLTAREGGGGREREREREREERRGDRLGKSVIENEQKGQ